MTEIKDNSPLGPANAGRIPSCPDCGETARGTLEVVQGVALVHADPETGRPVYAEQTDVDWSSQQVVRREGRPVWVCSCGNEWTADVAPQ